ncbi:MAG: response regulator transcription factor [Actinomycetes bacterium]|nr:response regulator transcription factor [Actinomycetes bacterium]
MSDNAIKILVVDDEESITEFVAYNLRKAGYAVAVAHDGKTALDVFNAAAAAGGGGFSLVVLDVMLPDTNGYEVCKRIRATSTAPVLYLSARVSENDKVVGLKVGGDDYMIKPFGVRELLARIEALLRRSRVGGAAGAGGGAAGDGTGAVDGEPGVTGDSADIIRVAGITLDQSAHVATTETGPIDLTPREFELLNCLMHRAGKVLSREQLLRDAWGWEYLVETKTVDTHVKRLRDKLEAAGIDPVIVETVRGYGYRFKGE